MQSFEERSVRSWSEESNGRKNLGSKKSFLEVAVAAPARVELASAGRVWGIILFGILSCCAIDAEVLEIHYIIKIASYEEASDSTRRRLARDSAR